MIRSFLSSKMLIMEKCVRLFVEMFLYFRRSIKRLRSSRADASYVDPLGPQVERPKTGAKTRVKEDDFADEELGEDLLPE